MKIIIPYRFWQIPHHILYDENMSFAAKWLWWYIQSKPDNWDFSSHRIIQETKESLNSVKKYLKELEDNWYLIRRRVRKENGTFDVIYQLDLWLNQDQSLVLDNVASNSNDKNTMAWDSESNQDHDTIHGNVVQYIRSISKNKSSIEETKNTRHKKTGEKTKDKAELIIQLFETQWLLSFDDIVSPAIQREYTPESIQQILHSFLKYYSANKDKIVTGFNIKSRFNTYCNNDEIYKRNILKKKIGWKWIENTTEEDYKSYIDQGFLQSPSCKFYTEQILPTLKTELEKQTFFITMDYIKNKWIGPRAWYQLWDWISKQLTLKWF